MTNSFSDTFFREIERIKKRPLILVIMIVIPLVLCFVLGETFKEGSPKNLPISVLDEDNSDLSRKIVRMVDATSTCEVKYRVSSLSEGKNLIVGGQTYALLVIPRDFKSNVMKGIRPKLVYYYNNQLLLVGGIITKDVNVAIQTVMAGITVEAYSRKGLPKDVAISMVNVIKVDEHVRSNPYLNYSFFLSIAAFVHTFQILITFLAIAAVGSEFKEGSTIEWYECAGKSVLVAVFAKLLPYILGFMLVIATVYSIYFVGYGAPFEGNPLFVVFATLLYILAYQLTGVMFVAITGNYRLSLSSGAFYTSLGFTFAGMTYPVIAMSPFGQFYSGLLPLRPYLALLIDQTFRGFPISSDFIYVIWLIALASLAIMFLPLLKKKMQDESSWYKI